MSFGKSKKKTYQLAILCKKNYTDKAIIFLHISFDNIYFGAPVNLERFLLLGVLRPCVLFFPLYIIGLDMPIVTFITDFGMKDPYVAMVKAVMLRINPAIACIDITHQLGVGDIECASFILRESYQYFPAGSVHLVVVDPTVGSERRAIFSVKNGHFFVGPDNGVLSPGLSETFEIKDLKVSLLFRNEEELVDGFGKKNNPFLAPPSALGLNKYLGISYFLETNQFSINIGLAYGLPGLSTQIDSVCP